MVLEKENIRRLQAFLFCLPLSSHIFQWLNRIVWWHHLFRDAVSLKQTHSSLDQQKRLFAFEKFELRRKSHPFPSVVKFCQSLQIRDETLAVQQIFRAKRPSRNMHYQVPSASQLSRRFQLVWRICAHIQFLLLLHLGIIVCSFMHTYAYIFFL